MPKRSISAGRRPLTTKSTVTENSEVREPTLKEKVMAYMLKANRPYNASNDLKSLALTISDDVATNMASPKTAVLNALTELSEDGHLSQKIYGKTTSHHNICEAKSPVFLVKQQHKDPIEINGETQKLIVDLKEQEDKIANLKSRVKELEAGIQNMSLSNHRFCSGGISPVMHILEARY